MSRSVGDSGGVVGGWEKFQKQKKNWLGGGEKIKFQKKKLRSRGKKNWEGGGERKGKQKKVNLGWHRDRKEHPISAPSIHVGALMGAGSLWPPFSSGFAV